METTDGKVLHKFKLYLPDVKDKLYRLRTIILQVAEKEDVEGDKNR